MAKPAPVAAAAAQEAERAEQAERALARYMAFGLPTATVVGALGVGLFASLGPALLVLAGGALLGTVALFWASVRTLSGEAPLPADLEAVAARRHDVDLLAERKQAILRALKDLEHERSIGKIDEDDFAEISATYREQAKEIMREMDVGIGPLRERAEKLAENYLRKRGLTEEQGTAPPTADSSGELPPAEEASRVACPKCETSNEGDATFCKKCGAPLGEAEAEPEVEDRTEKKDARA